MVYFLAETSYLFIYCKHIFFYIVVHLIIAALKSLSADSNSWVILDFMSVDCNFYQEQTFFSLMLCDFALLLNIVSIIPLWGDSIFCCIPLKTITFYLFFVCFGLTGNSVGLKLLTLVFWAPSQISVQLFYPQLSYLDFGPTMQSGGISINFSRIITQNFQFLCLAFTLSGIFPHFLVAMVVLNSALLFFRPDILLAFYRHFSCPMWPNLVCLRLKTVKRKKKKDIL